MKYGRLTIIGDEGRTIDKHKCICDCGNIHFVVLNSLRAGLTKSCGCIKRKHGKSRTPEYIAWKVMKNRCFNPNDPAFDNYGGRGIAVCGRWMDSFKNFIADMGNRPSPTHSIDRIDNDGNYEPGNCRWATLKQQGRNKRNSILLKYKGETKLLIEWCELLNLDYRRIHKRLHTGWSIEKALTEPKYGRYLP